MSPSRRFRIAVPAAIVAVVWALGFPALDRYNVTWDEALGDLFFGERYLSYFTSFDPAYLDFGRDPYPPERTPDLFVSPFKIRPWEYYPVANTLAAATSTVLSRWLGWLDPFDGFHAFGLVAAALLVACFHPFLATRLGPLAATAALGLLLTAPRVVADLMANLKDFPSMVAFTLAAVAFVAAYERGSPGGILASGVVWGLALGTKANALFLPPILLAVVVLGERPEVWRGRTLRLALLGAGGLLAGALTMIAVWPYLWPDPVGRYLEHLGYVGFRAGYVRPESLAPPLAAVLQTTPPHFLALAAVGFVPLLAAARRRGRTAILLLAWIAVVLGRTFLPGATNFDGVRHFLELFPALAAVAGKGVAELVDLARRRAGVERPRLLATAALALAVVPGLAATIRVHPFETCYWNLFAGGYAGARARGLPQAADYWGASYRLGLEWLSANAEPGAALAVPVVEHAVRLVAPLRLRGDLELLPVTTPFTPEIAPARLAATRELARRRPLYVMFVDRADWRNELMADCLTRLSPTAVWTLEGAPVLLVYRYEPPPDAGTP